MKSCNGNILLQHILKITIYRNLTFISLTAANFMYVHNYSDFIVSCDEINKIIVSEQLKMSFTYVLLTKVAVF